MPFLAIPVRYPDYHSENRFISGSRDVPRSWLQPLLQTAPATGLKCFWTGVGVVATCRRTRLHCNMLHNHTYPKQASWPSQHGLSQLADGSPGALSLYVLRLLSCITVKLNREAIENIAWWQQFLPTWNGTARFIEPEAIEAHNLDLSVIVVRVLLTVCNSSIVAALVKVVSLGKPNVLES